MRGAGVSVTTATTGPVRPLSPGVELSAYRIVQEALSNAMRHAPGAAVRVEDGVRARHPRRPASPTPRPSARNRPSPRRRPRAPRQCANAPPCCGGDLATGTADGGYEVTPSSPTAHPTEDTRDDHPACSSPTTRVMVRQGFSDAAR
ncbi:hypothetical protein [Streptomyces thioluteus]|uniref:hypothetical protein n=1 Tax=Streptomyces thioluteus TaxID=66431 RepID=UPI003CD0ADEE